MAQDPSLDYINQHSLSLRLMPALRPRPLISHFILISAYRDRLSVSFFISIFYSGSCLIHFCRRLWFLSLFLPISNVTSELKAIRSGLSDTRPCLAFSLLATILPVLDPALNLNVVGIYLAYISKKI